MPGMLVLSFIARTTPLMATSFTIMYSRAICETSVTYCFASLLSKPCVFCRLHEGGPLGRRGHFASAGDANSWARLDRFTSKREQMLVLLSRGG